MEDDKNPKPSEPPQPQNNPAEVPLKPDPALVDYFDRGLKVDPNLVDFLIESEKGKEKE